MIPKYRVIALKMGSLTVDKSTLTFGLDFGKEIEMEAFGLESEKANLP